MRPVSIKVRGCSRALSCECTRVTRASAAVVLKPHCIPAEDCATQVSCKVRPWKGICLSRQRGMGCVLSAVFGLEAYEEPLLGIPSSFFYPLWSGKFLMHLGFCSILWGNNRIIKLLSHLISFYTNRHIFNSFWLISSLDSFFYCFILALL